jgi:hypothetical protein
VDGRVKPGHDDSEAHPPSFAPTFRDMIAPTRDSLRIRMRTFFLAVLFASLIGTGPAFRRALRR